MASSYSTIGRIELMATGEKTNLWGPIANTGLQLLEDMIAGATTITDLGGTVTLTANNGATDQSRKGIIICNATLTSNLILVIPNVTKTYVVHNRTSGAYTVSIKTASGSALAIPQSKIALVACDAVTDANGKVTFVAGPTEPTLGGDGLQLYQLDANLAGSNATGNQKIFGKDVTLEASTVYEFEIDFILSKSAGTTSHSISLSFGGTATLNGIFGITLSNINTVLTTAGGTVHNFDIITASAVVVSSTTITAASHQQRVRARGSVSVNAGGTFIFQYSLSAAPGGAYSTLAGSFAKIRRLGSSGVDTNIGSWS